MFYDLIVCAVVGWCGCMFVGLTGRAMRRVGVLAVAVGLAAAMGRDGMILLPIIALAGGPRVRRVDPDDRPH